jgi:2'-5' RNA ligase
VPGEPSRPPLIVTLAIDDDSFAHFDALRRRWFPPERNHLPAHLTLFHKLPGEEEHVVGEALKAAGAAQSPFEMEVTGPWSLGRGVAFRLRAPALEALRAHLAAAFDPWLTPQDRGGFRPHVTVQNKVDPAEAMALLEALQHDFRPFSVRAEGLLVWEYLGGPWRRVARVPFEGS